MALFRANKKRDNCQYSLCCRSPSIGKTGRLKKQEFRSEDEFDNEEEDWSSSDDLNNIAFEEEDEIMQVELDEEGVCNFINQYSNSPSQPDNDISFGLIRLEYDNIVTLLDSVKEPTASDKLEEPARFSKCDGGEFHGIYRQQAVIESFSQSKKPGRSNKDVPECISPKKKPVSFYTDVLESVSPREKLGIFNKDVPGILSPMENQGSSNKGVKEILSPREKTGSSNKDVVESLIPREDVGTSDPTALL